MGKNEDTATEIMYHSGTFSKHKCPHDVRSNTSFWVIIVKARLIQTRKDPTLVIRCEGSFCIKRSTINVTYNIVHIIC